MIVPLWSAAIIEFQQGFLDDVRKRRMSNIVEERCDTDGLQSTLVKKRIKKSSIGASVLIARGLGVFA